MSCGRRVVHSLVAATLVAHWPQDGGASLPFPPLTLTPGADLRGGESNKHQTPKDMKHKPPLLSVFLSLCCQTASSLPSLSLALLLHLLLLQSFQLSAAFFYATCCCKCHDLPNKSFEMMTF